jgi:hypothetical protein
MLDADKMSQEKATPMADANPKAVADLIFRAGGHLIGRTRLQKSACLLELAGVGYGFQFGYRLFGPYSDELQTASEDADALGLIKERKMSANWGGWYSAFDSKIKKGSVTSKPGITRTRAQLLRIAAAADPVELELAITAAFLSANGIQTPWEKVAARKAAKATPVNMAGAKALYSKFLRVATPRALPKV